MEESSRRLEHIEKLVLDVTKATMTRSTKLDAKLDSLSKQVERLAAGAPREQAPPPREVPNEQHISSRLGAGEAEDMSALHTGLEVLSQPAYQLQTQRVACRKRGSRPRYHRTWVP